MLYTVKNDSQNPRVVFVAGQKPTDLPRGGEVQIEMEPAEAANTVAEGVTVTDPDGNVIEAPVYEKTEPGHRPLFGAEAEAAARGELSQLDLDNDGAAGGSVDELDQMKLPALKALAKSEGVDLMGATKAEDIKVAIRLDREAKAAPEAPEAPAEPVAEV